MDGQGRAQGFGRRSIVKPAVNTLWQHLRESLPPAQLHYLQQHLPATQPTSSPLAAPAASVQPNYMAYGSTYWKAYLQASPTALPSYIQNLMQSKARRCSHRQSPPFPTSKEPASNHEDTQVGRITSGKNHNWPKTTAISHSYTNNIGRRQY
jgi:hypothetical protein